MDQKILSKIKKCLDLAKSANENEAAQALRMAQKLMQKYSVSDDAIKFMGMGSTESQRETVFSPPMYMAILITKISKAFCVTPVIKRKCYGDVIVEFIGLKANSEIAAYSFDVVDRLLKDARKVYINGLHKNCKPITKTRRADLYCQGWVISACKSLVDLELDDEVKNAVSEYVKKETRETSQSKPIDRTEKVNHKHFHDGLNDGSKVKLSRPINGTKAAGIEKK